MIMDVVNTSLSLKVSFTLVNQIKGFLRIERFFLSFSNRAKFPRYTSFFKRFSLHVNFLK